MSSKLNNKNRQLEKSILNFFIIIDVTDIQLTKAL